MKKERLCVAIDCRMIKSSGIGTFLRGILPYMLKRNNIHFVLFGVPKFLIKYQKKNVKIVPCEIPIFSLKEIFCFPRKQLNGCKIFFTPNYNIPGFINIPVYSTIHDLIFLDLPFLKGFTGRLIRKLAALRAIKLSQNIFTVSKFSKSRILYHFPNSKNIDICYNGTDYFDTSKIEDPLLSITKEKYFLYVGNIKPQKGLHILLDAFEKFRNDDNNKQLVIVGNQKDFKTDNASLINRIEVLAREKIIVFTGYIPQSQLVWLMKNALCLIQPSIYEGFGLPPLEAMRIGTPVIISDIPVFKELYSEFPVVFFKTNNSDSLLNAMKRNFHRINLDKELREKYSYSQTASIIINRFIENSENEGSSTR